MVCIANHPIPHGIRSGIGAGRDVLTVCAVLGQAVLHGATAGHAARGNQRLLIAVVGQDICRRRGDRTGRDGGLGDGQLFVAARHRIAVLGGGEINVVGSDCVCGEVYDIVPVGANLLIFSFLLAVCGHVVSNDLPGVDVYIRTLRIAAGAELDGRAALHLRRVVGQVLAIDLQIQGLGGDGQAIDDNVVQLRIIDIIRGIPLVIAISVKHLVPKCFTI